MNATNETMPAGLRQLLVDAVGGTLPPAGGTRDNPERGDATMTKATTTTSDTLAGLIRAVRPFAARSRTTERLHDALVVRTLDATRVAATDLEIACTITAAPDGGPLGLALHDSVSGIRVTERSPHDYPCVRPGHPAPATPAATYRMGIEDVRRLAYHIAVATDDESSHYALGGLLIESDGPVLLVVATDGRRIHAARVRAEIAEGAVPAGAILPARLLPAFLSAVRQAARACLGADGQRAVRRAHAAPPSASRPGAVLPLRSAGRRLDRD